MPTSREQALADYCDELRLWGLQRLVVTWQRMDVADIRGSWARIEPDILALNTTVTTLALDAVDDYMTVKAADGGFRYTTTWQTDRPQRPYLTPSGKATTQAFRGVPAVVLWRIKNGHKPLDALVYGYNRAARVIGSQAHDVARTVPPDRVFGSA